MGWRGEARRGSVWVDVQASVIDDWSPPFPLSKNLTGLSSHRKTKQEAPIVRISLGLDIKHTDKSFRSTRGIVSD